MRHIPLDALLNQIYRTPNGIRVQQVLDRAHVRLSGLNPVDRQKYTRSNGGQKWRLIKELMIEQTGKKCWYTEVEIIGAALTIDHYRPIVSYWWLAFDADNYRVASPWANSPKHNEEHGCGGGKGDQFPLLPPAIIAADKNALVNEKPIVLDPCNSSDCDLLAFQVDGRPILNPAYLSNSDAAQRVDRSNILLNLDHPDFNTKREQLCKDIEADVNTYEDLPASSPMRSVVHSRIKARLVSKAPFSTAARYYLKLHRHLDWVEAILNGN